ncbi:MAG: protein adenylyltransferase SelO family protein [Sulfurimonas sp.]
MITAVFYYDGDKEALLDLCECQTPLKEWLEGYDARLSKEKISQQKRSKLMLGINPKYVLKNHLLQEAIEKEDKGDFSMIHDLLTVALDPYSEHKELEYLNSPTPITAKNLKLSCSS